MKKRFSKEKNRKAVSEKTKKAQVRLTEAQADSAELTNPYIPKKTKAEIANITAETKLKETQQNNAKKQFEILDAQAKKEIQTIASEYSKAQNEKQKAELEQKFYNTGFGKAMKYTGMTISSILPILNPIGKAINQ